ncbi:Mss4p nuclear export [Malassezia sp. CBS 17886]|nr:Mss4p nuclear export [Malassezia sp. CBS 17886]
MDTGRRQHDDTHNDEDDVDFVNVEFDFSAPTEVDFQALKRLYQQLFYTHAPSLDIGALADHTVRLAQDSGIGTVIKVDDLEQERDPYAVMSAVPLGTDAQLRAADVVRVYLESQLARSATAKPLLQLVQGASAAKPLLFVLHERMINLPVPVVPPLLRMLLNEWEEGRMEHTPAAPAPSHVLFFSRAFSADALEEGRANEDEPTGLAGARKRKAFASHTHTFRFPVPRDAAESFEAPIFGRVMAVPYERLPSLLARLEELWAPPQA